MPTIRQAKSLSMIASVAASALLFASVAQAEITLRLAHYASTGSTTHAAAEIFAEEVETRSNGEIKVSLHPAHELGDDPTQVRGVRLGTIDMAVIGNTFFTGMAPELNALDLPYLFVSREHAYRVLDGDIGADLHALFGNNGMQVLGNWEIGFRNITNSRGPIHSPEDLQGLSIRTTPNPAHVAAFEALGASPTPMSFSEVYLALETGAVDGQENPIVLIHAMRFHEVQKHMSLTRHAYTAAFLVMNEGRFSALSDEHQALLLEVGRMAGQKERDLIAEREAASLQAMRDDGLEVNENPDREAFRAVVMEATRAAYVEQFGSELLDRIDAAR